MGGEQSQGKQLHERMKQVEISFFFKQSSPFCTIPLNSYSMSHDKEVAVMRRKKPSDTRAQVMDPFYPHPILGCPSSVCPSPSLKFQVEAGFPVILREAGTWEELLVQLIASCLSPDNKTCYLRPIIKRLARTCAKLCLIKTNHPRKSVSPGNTGKCWFRHVALRSLKKWLLHLADASCCGLPS